MYVNNTHICMCHALQTGPATFYIVSIVSVILTGFDCTVLYTVKDEAVHEVGE